MRECELCNRPARMYCESDQASLCWNCDAKVHSANFLVARHCRNLLCHICQSPTPWKASGAKLGPTISVCDLCTNPKTTAHQESNGENEEETTEDEEEEEEEDEIDGPDDDDQVDDGDYEEDGENQVVPWSSTPSPPPPVASPSSSEDSSRHHHASASAEIASPLKRMRENADLGSQYDLGCSSSKRRAVSSIEEESVSVGSITPLNDGRKDGTVSSESRSVLIDSLQRLQREEDVICNDDEVPDLCNRNKDPTSVHLVSMSSP